MSDPAGKPAPKTPPKEASLPKPEPDQQAPVEHDSFTPETKRDGADPAPK